MIKNTLEKHKSRLAFILTAIAIVFVFVIGFANISKAGNNSKTKTNHIVTIYDRGQETIILTQAKNVADAIKESGIVIDESDAVEPGLTQELIAKEYSINIYRARPVIVVDGNVRQKIMTPYQTAEQIAQSANITIYPEDNVKVGLPDDLMDGAGLQLTITRAVPFQFNLYGKTNDTRTLGQTVGDMLKEKGINLTKDDQVIPGVNTKITAGMVVKLWREGKQTVTVDEVVAFQTETIENADLELGYKEVRAEGKDGKRSVTYEIVFENGVEVSRIEIASISITESTKKVEVIGIKGLYTTPTENENITWDFLISQGFSRVQTAGIMGNLMQEHGFQTSNTSGGLGIVQWTGGRRSELLSWEYPETINTQLKFLMYELNGKYSSVRDAIKSADSLVGALQIFQNRFERCGICVEDRRIEFARNILASH